MLVTEKLAARLKELRRRQGYSQETFAKKVELDRTYIAGIEAGKRNVSIVNLEKIANGLEISISELLDFEKPFNHTILLNIQDEMFLLESKQELTLDIIDEIEILCKCANNDESEFNEIRIREGYEDELYEMSTYDLADLFQKVVFEYLKIEVVFKPINVEAKIWL